MSRPNDKKDWSQDKADRALVFGVAIMFVLWAAFFAVLAYII